MIQSTAEAVAKLNKLGFPAIFEKIQLGTAGDFIQDNCAPPKRFLNFMKETSSAEFESWLPLWEFDGMELFAFDCDHSVYMRLDYSQGTQTVFAKSYQQLITRFFVELVVAGLEEEIPELATHFEYKHLDEFLRVVAIPKGDDWKEVYEQFVNSLPYD